MSRTNTRHCGFVFFLILLQVLVSHHFEFGNEEDEISSVSLKNNCLGEFKTVERSSHR